MREASFRDDDSGESQHAATRRWIWGISATLLLGLAVAVVAAGAYYHWSAGKRLATIASADDWKSVHSLAAKGAPINIPDGFGNTALVYAASCNDITSIHLLLDKGANPNVRMAGPGFDWTPLMWVSLRGNVAAMHLLLERGAELETKTDRGETALSFAVLSQSEPALRLLIERGAQLNFRDIEGKSPLIHAAQAGWAGGVRTLLEHSADVNLKDHAGHFALYYGRHPVPRLVDAEHRKELPVIERLLRSYGAKE